MPVDQLLFCFVIIKRFEFQSNDFLSEERLRAGSHIGGRGKVGREARQPAQLPASVHFLARQASKRKERATRYRHAPHRDRQIRRDRPYLGPVAFNATTRAAEMYEISPYATFSMAGSGAGAGACAGASPPAAALATLRTFGRAEALALGAAPQLRAHSHKHRSPTNSGESRPRGGRRGLASFYIYIQFDGYSTGIVHLN